MALQVLDKKLTCYKCNKLLKDPRQLAGCEDTFCLGCIKELDKTTKDDNSVFVTCPKCQIVSHLPKGGVDQLPINPLIAQLFEVREQLLSSSDDVGVDGQSPKEETCSEHDDVLKGYCETCEKVICRDCTMSLKHSGHAFCLITECYSKHSIELEMGLDGVKRKADKLNKGLINISKMEDEVNKRKESVKDDIEAHAQQIMEVVQLSKERLFTEVDSLVSRKTENLLKQKTEATMLLKRLQECESKVAQTIKEASQAQVLMKKPEMMAEMKTACDAVDDPSIFQPIESSDMKFARNLSLLSEQAIGEYVTTSFTEAVINTDTDDDTSTPTRLAIKSHDGGNFPIAPDLIRCKVVSSTSNDHPILCSVSKTIRGDYLVNYPPSVLQSSQSYQLVVTAGGIEVARGSLSLQYSNKSPPSSPELPLSDQTIPVIKTITKLQQPKGISVSGNLIAVVENNVHCVTILGRDGERINTYGNKNIKKSCFTYPRGVTIDKDEVIYVTDEHRLHKLDISSKRVVKTIGKTTPGKGCGEFRNPHDIAIHPSSGHVFVADSGNNRIQVFKSDLSFLYIIENYQSMLSVTECFNEPIGVAFDGEGNLYISEYLNHCITKVTPKGQFVAKIGSEGSEEGNLYGPTSIAINNGYLYIAEMGMDRVSVFNIDGTFVRCFWNRGQDIDSSTYGIAVAPQGRIYITDNMNSITIY